jgi:DNA processing protein
VTGSPQPLPPADDAGQPATTMVGAGVGGPVDDARLPEAAWVAALAGLPGMGPVRLSALLRTWPATEAWARVSAGGVHRVTPVVERSRGLRPEVAAAWAVAAREVDVGAAWERHRRAEVEVLVPGADGWPVALDDDPEPPAVLFVRGDPAALVRPAVAIVGTRRCTPTGRAVATELGRDLATAGVSVVSGLALGVDGAAHTGALVAPPGAAPVAVVGTGVDVTYPRAHVALAERVAAVGAVVSEYPLGTPPAAWRFPARNRIIAGLCDVLVVVESARTGGSMHTVDAAIERGRPVLAVPGSVRNPAAAGTNELLSAGCAPARDVTDVLVALGLGTAPERPPEPAPAVSKDQALVLDALGWDASTLEQVADRLGDPLGPVALHLTDLVHAGIVVRTGAWYTRTAAGGR